MKLSKRIAVAVAGYVMLGSSLSANAKPMSAEAFTSEIVGKAITWHSEKSPSVGGMSLFAADGVQKLYDIKGIKGLHEDTGKWWFEGDKVCNQFKKIRKGQKACQDITSLGSGKYRMGSSLLQK